MVNLKKRKEFEWGVSASRCISRSSVLISASGIQLLKSMVNRENRGKGSRLIGFLTLGKGLALAA